MAVYHLYLDESETSDNQGNNKVFCIAGIIVEEKDVGNVLAPAMTKLKKTIWGDIGNPENIVMHEKDVRFANNFRNKKRLSEVRPEFHRFEQNEPVKMLYNEIEKIYRLNTITVIGSCVVIDELYKHFHPDIISDKYIICMQMLLENFCQFLKARNSVGYVFYESREEHQDRYIRKRFIDIKAMGSLFVSSYAMQTLLKDITFPSKGDNNCGLQMADFVPNGFARQYGQNKDYRFNINSVLNQFRYDGGLGKPDRFGIKVMP